MQKLFASLGQMLFPDLCVVCQDYLTNKERCICDLCSYTLPKYEQSNIENNSIEKALWGRAKLAAATSLFRFDSTQDVQQILHQIKYRGNQKLAIYMGEQLGLLIRNQKWFDSVDTILPVPLHPKKYNLRGCNQSLLLAQGILNVTMLPISEAVERIHYVRSQTKLNRYERFSNVEMVFKLTKPEELRNKNILIVDDVFTTGATIEAMLRALKDVDLMEVMFASLAVTI